MQSSFPLEAIKTSLLCVCIWKLLVFIYYSNKISEMNSPLSFVLFLISHPEIRKKEYCINPLHLEVLWVLWLA